MFAYCGNNPIINFDPTGHLYRWRLDPSEIKDMLKSAAQKTKSWSQQTKNELAKSGNGTYARGINFSLYGGAGFSIAVGYTLDRKGNIGLIFSANGGGGLPGASISRFDTITNAPDIYKLKGYAGQAGGSVAVGPFSIGTETEFFRDADTDEGYLGQTLNSGLGLSLPVPVEMHGGAGASQVVGFNIFDVIEDVCDTIIEWD